MTNAINAIEIRGLVRRFAKFTLGPLDLTVPQGAIYGLVGPNGAGKTTAIDAIFGAGPLAAGTITVGGFDHTHDEVAVKSQIGYASPDLTFAGITRVKRAITFTRAFYPSWDDEYCARLLDTFGLRLNDYVSTLSFGAKIKLALLLALAWRPKILVLDEPTVGLDAVAKQQVFEELLTAVGAGGRSVLISSHALTDLERFADHVGILSQGRMVVEGPMTDVVARYRIVDVIVPRGLDASALADVVVQRRDGERWRLLVDLQSDAMHAIAQLGLQIAAEAPVNLEELFVALAKGKAA